MDTKSNNAKATNTRRKESQVEFGCYSQNQRTVEGDSKSIEYQSERTTGKVGRDVGPNEVDRTFGGVLDLVREVGKEGLDYMDEDGDRLEKRLIDHKKKKANFLEKFAALEKELARMTDQVPQNPENDHTQEE